MKALAKIQQRLVHRDEFPKVIVAEEVEEISLDGEKVRLRTPQPKESCILNWFLALLIVLSCSGCGGLFVTPQIPTGGLNSNTPEESPAYSGDGRYLAFASDRAGERNIYLFDLQQRALIPTPNLNRRDSTQDQPALSADGRYLAYVSTERGKPDVFVYDRQSARSQLLTANARGTVARPTISGDGSTVAFQTTQRGQWNIAIVERP